MAGSPREGGSGSPAGAGADASASAIAQDQSAGAEKDPLGVDRPTRQSEMWAWRLYFAAYEPVSIVVLQLLFPLLLSSTALRASVRRTAPHGACVPGVDVESDCVLIGGRSPAFLTYLILALSVLAQTLAFVSAGAVGDWGRWRARLLAIFTALGGTLCLATLGAIGPRSLVYQCVLFVALQVAFGSASVFYNALLPVLSASHPKVLACQAPGTSDSPPPPAGGAERIASGLSLTAYMFGYGAALLELVVTAGLLAVLPRRLPVYLQLPIAMSGLVWLLGGLLAIRWLRERPGPPYPRSAGNPIVFAWKSFLWTVDELRRLPNLRRYLIGYLFFSDGYGTIGMVAVLFARGEMSVPEWLLVVSVGVLLVSSVAGSFFYWRLQRALGLDSLRMTILLCAVLSVIPGWGLLGLFTNRIGLHRQWEVFLVAAYYGFSIGAANSYARVAYADLIPKARAAEFFSLYAITDKGSSCLGPLIFALLSLVLDERRWGLLALLAFLLLPLPFLWRIDLAAGRREADQVGKPGVR